MINIGDLVLATESMETPTVGVITAIVNHPTFVGVQSVEIWWADNGKKTLILKEYAVSLKKDLDKYLAG